MTIDSWPLRYTPYNYARIIKGRDLATRDADALLKWAVDKDDSMILPQYVGNLKLLRRDVERFLYYLNNRREFLVEIDAIEKEFEESGARSDTENFLRLADDQNHYLKELRLRAIYFNKTKSVRTNIRRILTQYKMKRRSREFIEQLEDALGAYGLIPMDGKERCDLMSVPIDRQITFIVDDDVHDTLLVDPESRSFRFSNSLNPRHVASFGGIATNEDELLSLMEGLSDQLAEHGTLGIVANLYELSLPDDVFVYNMEINYGCNPHESDYGQETDSAEDDKVLEEEETSERPQIVMTLDELSALLAQFQDTAATDPVEYEYPLWLEPDEQNELDILKRILLRNSKREHGENFRGHARIRYDRDWTVLFSDGYLVAAYHRSEDTILLFNHLSNPYYIWDYPPTRTRQVREFVGQMLGNRFAPSKDDVLNTGHTWLVELDDDDNVHEDVSDILNERMELV